MAEPLGLASGIAGLLSLTIQLLQVTSKFKDDALSCKKDVESFVQELTELNRVLELLRDAWKEKRLPPNFDLSALAGIERACEEQLKSLLERLTKAAGWMQRTTNFSLRGVIFRLEWPLEAERTRRITDTIHRYFAIFTWVLHFRESEILLKLSEDTCKILKKQDKILDQFRAVFQFLEDVRHPIDAATNISNSILRAVEGRLNILDEIHEDVKSLKTDTEKVNLHSEEEARRMRGEIIKNYKEGKRKEFLNQMPTIAYLDKQRQSFETHEPGTGKWFLTDPRYQSWKDSDRPSTLLCQGAPGTGKTVLTSLAVDDVSNNGPEDTIQVAYLYCDYRNQSKETVPILLSSLMRQLLTSERLIFPFVRDKCLDLCVKYTKPDTLVAEHVSLIRILAKMSSRTYLFVDAIDEVAQSEEASGRDVRLKFLEALFRLSDACHVFLTSRPHVNADCFKALSASQKIQVRASDEDISAFVTSSISACATLTKFTEQDPTLKETIIKTVQAKSQQVFLLARFHISCIAVAVSPRDVRDLLASLSGSLTDVYGFCLERLRCQAPRRWLLAKRALCWISKAERPLTVLELTHALSFKFGDTEILASEAIDVSMIIDACDGLICLEPVVQGKHTLHPVVTFTHSTLAEFMHQLTASSDFHHDIANTSLGYLVMYMRAVTDQNFDGQRVYPFLSYATSFWGSHAAKTRRKVDTDLLLQFAYGSTSPLAEISRLGLDYALRFLLNSGFSANSFPDGISPLMIAATHGHPRCVSVLLEAGADVNYVSKKAKSYNTAVSCAAGSGNSESVRLLIRASANLDIGITPPIICAIEASHYAIVEQLLDAGCNQDIKFANKTPLFIALESNNIDMADLLMQGGANLNATSTAFQITPLQLTIHQNQWDAAMNMVFAGADPGKQSHVDLSPLQKAAYEGNTELVQALLQASKTSASGNELDQRDECLGRLIHGEIEVSRHDDGTTTFAIRKHKTGHSSKSPLHLALEGRHLDTAQPLIEAGIGINEICGSPPYTALEWAVYQDEPTLMAELLAAGADPNLGGIGIPLLSAISRYPKAENQLKARSTAIIAQLLDVGATPHASQGKFRHMLQSRINDNVENKWWERNDPTVKRLRAALSLSEEWVVP